jgi:hypothetical protein
LVGSAEPDLAALLRYVSIGAVFVCKVLIGNRAAARNQFLKNLCSNQLPGQQSWPTPKL